MRGIIKWNDSKKAEILRQQGRKVDPSDCGKVFTRLAQKTINKRDGAIGFAANQVGLNDHAFFALISAFWRLFANADIVWKNNIKKIGPEGCLSLPGRHDYHIQRWDAIEITFLDSDGKQQQDVFGGSAARVIQHEIDHLNGILISDKEVKGSWEFR